MSVLLEKILAILIPMFLRDLFKSAKKKEIAEKVKDYEEFLASRPKPTDDSRPDECPSK